MSIQSFGSKAIHAIANALSSVASYVWQKIASLAQRIFSNLSSNEPAKAKPLTAERVREIKETEKEVQRLLETVDSPEEKIQDRNAAAREIERLVIQKNLDGETVHIINQRIATGLSKVNLRTLNLAELANEILWNPSVDLRRRARNMLLDLTEQKGAVSGEAIKQFANILISIEVENVILSDLETNAYFKATAWEVLNKSLEQKELDFETLIFIVKGLQAVVVCDEDEDLKTKAMGVLVGLVDREDMDPNVLREIAIAVRSVLKEGDEKFHNAAWETLIKIWNGSEAGSELKQITERYLKTINKQYPSFALPEELRGE